MARSRRDLVILAPIGATSCNFTHTYLHHDVFALEKVADFAPSNLGTAVYKNVVVHAAFLRRRMARSRRDLAILAPIGATFRNFTPTNPHRDVFAVGKVADFAPSNLITGV